MRLVPRLGLFGIVPVAVVVMLGGCGGGSNPAARKLHAVLSAGCGESGIEDKLRGLAAGVAATEREFESAGSGGDKSQILQSMKENIAAIHRELSPLEACTRNVLREREGKRPLGVGSASPRRPTAIAIAHRIGPPRVEPGVPAHPASPCQAYGKNRTTTLYIWPDSPGCAQVAPGERLRVANMTGIGSLAAGVALRVQLGDGELWLAPGQAGLIPAPVETYLGRGTHAVRAAGGLGPTVFLLPRGGCAIRPPAKPGEELCFR
jgi:hypothetical protein